MVIGKFLRVKVAINTPLQAHFFFQKGNKEEL